VVYVSHGGGPLPLLGDPEHAKLIAHFSALPSSFDVPDAILVISAHWEAPRASITAGSAPALIYDYGGFPPEAYRIKYPAPGSPELADSIGALLTEHGITMRLDPNRGWDHGVFVPLALMYPQAQVPVVQLSLLASLDSREHIALGEALAALREQNMLLLGSGSSFHNMHAFFSGQGLDRSIAFSDWLIDCLCGAGQSSAERRDRLMQWQSAPYARFCHPREEHLLPLMVCLGAARYGGAGECLFSDRVMGQHMVSFGWFD
jgi:aromatic ring-opening dioxygenase catalytic subunit (LigB family)